MTDAELERRLRTGLSAPAAGPVDVDSAWRDFQYQTLPRGRRRRRRRAVASMATAAVVVAVAGVLAAIVPGLPSGSHPDTAARPGSRHAENPGRTFPQAVVARIPVAGLSQESGSVVADGGAVWTMTTASLVRIDVAASRVTLRVPITSQEGAGLAAGGGAVWLTTGSGPARGQLVRIDPATGHVTATLHLAGAGRCGSLAYGFGHLWAGCGAGPGSTEFLRINPATGAADARLGPVRGADLSPVLTPQGMWYSAAQGPRGFVRRNGQWRPVALSRLSWLFGLQQDSPVYGLGALWVLSQDESISKIDPATGKIERVFTYLTFDPVRGPNLLGSLAVGDGSLWLLGYQTEVLRVSARTGRALGWLPPLGSCQPFLKCGLIDATPGAVWVPVRSALVHIDPARMPG